MKSKLRVLAVVAAMATTGVMLATTTYAQTNGMGRRDDRRDNRDDSREAKAECKAGDDSQAECRQDKRDTKQEGRGNDDADKAPADDAAAARG